MHNHIRGLSPAPGAWFEALVDGKPERVRVLRSRAVDGAGTPGEVLDDALTIACGTGAIRIEEAQRAGKRPMQAAELLRGFPLRRGSKV